MAAETGAVSSADAVPYTSADLSSAESIAAAAKHTVLQFGGIDGIVNTAAIYPVAGVNGQLTPEQWNKTFLVNVTGNFLLAQETHWIFRDQKLLASIVLMSSANAVVPKHGSEVYDVSKSAVNHLIRELAMSLAPLVRVNGIAPATVVAGSTMFPRDRVIHSLRKYQIEFSEEESTEDLRTKLAAHTPSDPSARLRECHRLALRRRKRENDGACYSGGRRTAGSVSAIRANANEACLFCATSAAGAARRI